MIDPYDSVSWYRSKTIVGAIISGLTKVLVISGAVEAVAPEQEEALSTAIVLAIGGVMDLWIIINRITSNHSGDITK